MKAVIQRVKKANVRINSEVTGKINKGLVVLLGIGKEDTEQDAEYLIEKIINLRIFEDFFGKMNESLLDIKGELLVVSQFTLYGNCRKGRRPSFENAAPPEIALKLYDFFVNRLKKLKINTATGTFQAYMQVEIHNDGPVTIIIDSNKN